MSSPLWYQVSIQNLSFKEFLDRFDDKQFQEHDVLPIFMLSVLYNHDPYVNGIHILNLLMKNTSITDRALKYVYVYWSIKKDFGNATILAGSSIGGTFQNINIQLHPNFTCEYIYDWIGIILKSFFNIRPFIPIEI